MQPRSAAAMQVPCLLSGDMIQQMQLWEELYLNRAGWIRNRIRSCHIPANIAQELKRLTLTEFSATVHDGAELEQAVSRVLPKLRRKMDFGLAIGGLLLKPYFTAPGRFGGHCAAERLSSGELHGRFL